MCQSCKEGYSRTGDNVCGKCPSETENIWRLTILFVVIIFIAGLMVKSTRDTAFSPSVIISIYIKIFINYLQLVSIVSTLDLDWPDQVKTIFSIQNSANSVSEQIVSFDCLLQISQPVADIYYIKLIIMSLLPLLVVIISVFFWAFVKIIYKKSQHIKSVF